MTRLHRIGVRGARTHNLRNVDVDVPHGRLTVVTGVSGSGKSSLALHTVHAEGRRRYLDSLSTHARMFVQRVPRPDVDVVDGLPPTAAIDQRTSRGGSRATVASLADILELLRLLWARLGTRHCEQCLAPVGAADVETVVEAVRRAGGRRRRVHLLAPVVRRRKGYHQATFRRLAAQGIDEARVDGERRSIDGSTRLARWHEHSVDALVAVASTVASKRDALEDAVRRTLRLGDGALYVTNRDDLADAEFHSTRSACADCGIAYGPVEPGDLSHSLRRGRCRRCGGRGHEETDEGGEPPPCKRCAGARLGAAARAVLFRGEGLHELLARSVQGAQEWLLAVRPANARERAVLAPIRDDVVERLGFVRDVGLDYLTLDRGARTLSGGESQRVRLAAQLGGGLRGVCYVLDEPTIGLHARDTERLIATLRRLTARGATLLVVEHDEDTIRAADHVVDLGPGAGAHGGRLVAAGSPQELEAGRLGVTGAWLADASRSAQPPARRRPETSIELRGARARNLKDVDVRFPLGALTCVSGVSGSGKSTLVRHVLLPALLHALGRVAPEPGEHDGLDVPDGVAGVVEVDQSPIGRTPRSVPATYTKLMGPLRSLFAASPDARAKGFTASRFSFNSGDGRCVDCKGRGAVKMEMSFLPGVAVPCETCEGARWDEETLTVRIAGRSIADVLAMTVAEARPVFAAYPRIAPVLDVMDDVGLGYLRLGQTSTTLSGGEAQRVKLATEMARRRRGGRVYVLDEPTTGLHGRDVTRLIGVLDSLVELGNTVIVIEHNVDVLLAADHVIDLGPGGGADGGSVMAVGTPEEVAAVPESATGACLAARLGTARTERRQSTQTRRRRR